MKPSAAPKTILLLAASAAILPILLSYVLLARYARGFPMFDDYLALLQIADRFHTAASLPDKLTLLIATQHSEYKLILENAIVATDLTFTGRVHLLLYVWLGNLSLLVLLYLLWKGLFPRADRQTRALLMVPVCWLLFQLNYAEALDWAMGGLQCIPVIVFAAGSLLLLQHPDRRLFALSCVMASLAVCGSANGALLALVGLLLLAPRRAFLRMLGWLLSFGVSTALYLFRYIPTHHGAQGVSLRDRLLMLLSFLGSAVENRQHHPVPYASVVLGVLLVAVAAIALKHGYPRDNPLVAGLWLWLVLSGVPVVLFRADELRTAQLAGRYKIYSDLLLILSFAFAARHVTALRDVRKYMKALTACAAVCVVFSLFSDVVGVRFLQKRLTETRAAFLQRNIPAEWDAALTGAERYGIYTPPAKP